MGIKGLFFTCLQAPRFSDCLPAKRKGQSISNRESVCKNLEAFESFEEDSAMNAPPLKLLVDLSSYESFMQNPWTHELTERYKLDAITAKQAIEILIDDLKRLNSGYMDEKSRTLFTTLEGRVKGKGSFFKKLYERCKEHCRSQGFDKENLESWYQGINDLAGVRFSCPYFDEVEIAIRDKIRPFLESRGYATDLSSAGMKDKNYLDKGDENGYRSFHFFLKVPTVIDIYGTTKGVICEVQGRSELQHVWAVKSHDLLYKAEEGWLKPNAETLKDMQELSNNLRSVDHFLCRIRHRVRGN
jgi:ppGpp synthetase/RelA/SpoT-type nucleotidyltranferase